jgi:3-dehydroquinate dehydratase
MLREYRTPETYRRLFDAAGSLPVYVTNYRDRENEGKDDDTLGRELIELAECGATLCDVMGDMFCVHEDQLTMDETAVKKQMKLIEDIHKAGAEVLMSSHVMRFISTERVLEIAFEQQRRGADICKIVVGAENMEQQLENLRIATLLKEKLSIPFLFLSGGETRILRRFGGELGCCMYLCVHEYDNLATEAQPLISCVKEIRDGCRKFL